MESGGWHDNDEYKDPNADEVEEDQAVEKDSDPNSPDATDDSMQVTQSDVSSTDALLPDTNPTLGAPSNSTDAPPLASRPGEKGAKDTSCTEDECEIKQSYIPENNLKATPPENSSPTSTSTSSATIPPNIQSGAPDVSCSSSTTMLFTDANSETKDQSTTDALAISMQTKEAIDSHDSVETDLTSPQNSISQPTALSTTVNGNSHAVVISNNNSSSPKSSSFVLQDDDTATPGEETLSSPPNSPHDSLGGTPDLSNAGEAKTDQYKFHADSVQVSRNEVNEKETPPKDAPTLPNHPKENNGVIEDQVEAAARAIAAKAVASTSHLLFPRKLCFRIRFCVS